MVHSIFQVLSIQRYNKRFSKLVITSVVVTVMLISLHFVAVNYSHRYSEISSNVGSILQDILIDEDSYIYKSFEFQGSLPSEMSERDVLEWNNELYKEEMNKPVNFTEELPLFNEHYKKRSDSTFVVQMRNKDLKDTLYTIKQIEAVFNDKFQYPYVFLNIDEEYSSNFQNTIKKHLPDRELYFEHIPQEDLHRPRTIDREREQIGLRKLKQEGLIPAVSVRLLKNIFRYMSYKFYQHPRLQNYKWYWKFEPGTNFFNEINYDIFQYMENNDKTFGFSIATYEYDPLTVENLFPTVLKFLSEDENINLLHPNNSKGFISENLINPDKTAAANGYSTCHFWSSLEIGNMEFFRSDTYKKYFEYLDNSGGFYYDRWSDGPVHTLALSLFEDRSKLHWFKDISYEQYPFFNCAKSNDNNCVAAKFSDDEFLGLNCLPMWLEHH